MNIDSKDHDDEVNRGQKSPGNITQPFGDILMNKITKIITIN